MKSILLFACIIIGTSTLNAQKILSTKSGQITFFSNAPLEDIEAKNSEVESKLLPTNGQLVFTLLMKGFEFENQLMEDHFNEDYLESSKFPKSSFKGFITNVKEINFAKDGTYPAKVKGDLTIHGVTKPVEANGTVTVKGAKVAAKSKFNIKLSDYGIGGKMVGDKIAQNIAITVDCQYE
ncbi:YceI family protein [Segetibacter sp. 3557_3]|uniref:YceI family protein n=1 Tax=Segetibacter sp. 3557_3 TaxID=2547429 RepID=UPI001058ABF3|nr:YceI family protein [Segetibacter sp. 3557_3]TDH24004.1 YceI family protein [Segetibacter sp. 3557_3]